MKIDGWRYYNNAAIPMIPPHKKVDLKPIIDGTIWKIDNEYPLLVRWIEDFDCGYETDWWHCIKDEPFDFSQIKSRYRTEIRKSLQLNDVKIIEPLDYVNDIYDIFHKCYSEYPEEYKKILTYDEVKKYCEEWSNSGIVYMAFKKDTNEILGFTNVDLIFDKDYALWGSLKVPNINKKNKTVAAIIYFMLNDLINDKGYKYISDGERNLVHDTNFMEYLVKHFGFRYAYCKLKIKYRFDINIFVNLLWYFRKYIHKHNRGRLMYRISAILKMEEIARKYR